MNKKQYSKSFEELLKKSNVNKSELAKALGCSADQITRLIKAPESANIERFALASDYLGKSLYEILELASDVNFVYDKPLESVGRELHELRDEITKVTKQYQEKDEYKCIEQMSKNVIKTVRAPVVNIVGDFSSGKCSLAENLCGTKFKIIGFAKSRVYSSFIITNTDNSPIQYNYFTGEYLYKITDEEMIPFLIENKLSKKDFNSVTVAVAKTGMNEYANYILYIDSSENNYINYICQNINNPYGKHEIASRATDINSIIFNSSDVIVFMLSENESFSSAITPLLLSCWERWERQMLNHMFFLIPKSDRYAINEIDNIIIRYAEHLKTIIQQINPEIITDIEIRDRIFSYSSFNTDKENVVSASFNKSFYKELYNVVSMLSDVQKISYSLSFELEDIRERILDLHEQTLNYHKLSCCKADINNFILQAKKYFDLEFGKEYQKILDVDNIISIIEDKNNEISRKQEDRQKLIRIVNAQLTNKAINIACKERGYLRETLIDYAKRNELDVIIDYVNNIPKAREKSDNSHVCEKNDIGFLGTVIGATVGLAVAFPLTLAVMVNGAATAAASYYAQNESTFKKNTAKKIISEYNLHGIQEEISKKVNAIYFEKIKNDLITILDSKINESDEKLTVEYIDSVLKVLSKY